MVIGKAMYDNGWLRLVLCSLLQESVAKEGRRLLMESLLFTSVASL